MGRIIPGEGEVAGREGPPVLPALDFLEIEENRRAPGETGAPEAPGAPGAPGATGAPGPPGARGAPGGTRTRGNHESPLHGVSWAQRRRGTKNRHQV